MYALRIQNLSSPTRDRTCTGSTVSQPLDCQGNPSILGGKNVLISWKFLQEKAILLSLLVYKSQRWVKEHRLFSWGPNPRSTTSQISPLGLISFTCLSGAVILSAGFFLVESGLMYYKMSCIHRTIQKSWLLCHTYSYSVSSVSVILQEDGSILTVLQKNEAHDCRSEHLDKRYSGWTYSLEFRLGVNSSRTTIY